MHKYPISRQLLRNIPRPLEPRAPEISLIYKEVSTYHILKVFENLNETMKTSRLGLFLCFSRFSHGQLKDCFYMEGYLASIDLPCDPEAEVSTGNAFISDWFDRINDL